MPIVTLDAAQNAELGALSVVILSVIAAGLPTLVFVGLVYWIDHYEKEPAWLLSATFLWGALPSVAAALLFNTLLTVPPALFFGADFGMVVGSTVVAPLVEESLKGLAVLGILFLWRCEIDSLLDGIIYGAMVGLGFAMVENFVYFVSTYGDAGLASWQLTIFLRAIVFGLNHALYSSLVGLGVAVSRLASNRWVKVLAPVIGWTVAVFLHFVHNSSATIGRLALIVTLVNAWGGVLLILTIIAWALIQERQWIKRYLADEVSMGTLTASQYRNAYSTWRASVHRYRLLFTSGLSTFLQATRFYSCCSELAYKKHHLRAMRDQHTNQHVEQIRLKVNSLSRLID